MSTKDKAFWRAAETHFQKRADALLSGSFDWLIGQYRFPFVLFEENAVSLEMSPTQTRKVLMEFRDRLLNDDVARISVTVPTLEPTGDGRIKATTFWEFQKADSARVYCAIYHFYGTMTPPEEFVAEMMEYESAAAAVGPSAPFGRAYLH